MKRIVFYNRGQFNQYKKQQESNGKLLLSMSEFLNSERVKNLDQTQEILVDLSSTIGFMRSNDTQTLNFEQLLNGFGDNIDFICDAKYEEDVKYLLRYVFDTYDHTDVLDEENSQEPEDASASLDVTKLNVKRIVDIDEDELSTFFNEFDSKLYGHDRFKSEFKEIVHSFRIFNRLGEHKILSLFLMGDSGIGKTEVARTIHRALGAKKKIAKVNFGNYSSHDALNSLIGSPLGYIGSDGGELVKRLKESDIGLILIDEFEKADGAVFNYFLDVLENGKIVNSQAEEYDVDGYIIVFTSNISKKDYLEKLSPELRSRFDYVGMFDLLTDEDKTKFTHFRINEIIEKYNNTGAKELPKAMHEIVYSQIDVSSYSNMRKLNKRIKDIFVREIRKINSQD